MKKAINYREQVLRRYQAYLSKTNKGYTIITWCRDEPHLTGGSTVGGTRYWDLLKKREPSAAKAWKKAYDLHFGPHECTLTIGMNNNMAGTGVEEFTKLHFVRDSRWQSVGSISAHKGPRVWKYSYQLYTTAGKIITRKAGPTFEGAVELFKAEVVKQYNAKKLDSFIIDKHNGRDGINVTIRTINNHIKKRPTKLKLSTKKIVRGILKRHGL